MTGFPSKRPIRKQEEKTNTDTIIVLQEPCNSAAVRLVSRRTYRKRPMYRHYIHMNHYLGHGPGIYLFRSRKREHRRACPEHERACKEERDSPGPSHQGGCGAATNVRDVARYWRTPCVPAKGRNLNNSQMNDLEA